MYREELVEGTLCIFFTPEEGRNIIDEENDNFELIYDKITDNSRWSIMHEIVIKEKSSGRYFMSYYSIGSTESQDESPYEYDKEAIFKQVVPVETKVIVYQ